MTPTYIWSCEPGERHLEVQVGNVETRAGTRHVFAAVKKSDIEAAEVIERCLAGAGRTAGTRLTAFTDGCAGLRKLLTDIGVTEPPILDWFHIAMGLQHLRQAGRGLPTRDQAQHTAKAVIVEAVERLRWRLWHRNAKDARVTIDRIRGVMRAYRDQQAQWRKHPCRSDGSLVSIRDGAIAVSSRFRERKPPEAREPESGTPRAVANLDSATRADLLDTAREVIAGPPERQHNGKAKTALPASGETVASGSSV